MGQLGFEGGEVSNSLRIIGGGSGYTAQHLFSNTVNGQLRYSDASSNIYHLTFTGINNIADNLTASSLTVNGTTQADTFLLTNRAHAPFNHLYSFLTSLIFKCP